MSIFLDKNTKVIVQGITGAEGSYHTDRMLKYGTNIVGGVTPGKGGQKTPQGLPVFNTVKEPSKRPARRTPASSCRRRLPPTRSSKPMTPASRFAVCITEGVPVHDMLKVVANDAGHADHRPELPRPRLAGQSARRHHARATSLRKATSA